MVNLRSKLPDLSDLDKLIIKVIQFHNPDIVSLSYRNIQDQLEQLIPQYPEVFGENNRAPSVSTISKRIKELKELGVIKYPTTVVECSMLGYREMVLIHLKTNLKRSIGEILESIAAIPQVNLVYQISGEYSIFCLSKCAEKSDQIELLERIKRIDGIEDMKTSVVLQKAKEDMRALVNL